MSAYKRPIYCKLNGFIQANRGNLHSRGFPQRTSRLAPPLSSGISNNMENPAMVNNIVYKLINILSHNDE